MDNCLRCVKSQYVTDATGKARLACSRRGGQYLLNDEQPCPLFQRDHWTSHLIRGLTDQQISNIRHRNGLSA